ncbi:hypothetical protein LOCC1_G004781 [Lachnellula occidentalis]|uniref:Uncharacterized protein n=1 Tax=Lachnellula occidentalis TaxID=215460 RepID=A0A8H8RZE5_9HELO|nr:hypothetical protein LOCC1_G004781 [Lachnellula occidentalis]
MASQHAHAPWRKTVLVPFWTIQLGFMLAFIALLAVAVRVLGVWKQTDNTDDYLDGVSDHAVTVTSHIVIPIYFSVCGVCLILTITEIILLARHKLKPRGFVIMNVIKSAMFTAFVALDIISLVGARTTSLAGSIIIDGVLFLSFLIPLIYGSVIYHRSRKSQTYRPVEHRSLVPEDNIAPTGYPLQYKQFIVEVQHEDVEASFGRPKRLSYNHQRDTKFESYRQEGSSSPLKSNADERPLGSPSVPEVRVQHHDGVAFEMGESRANLT